MGKRVSQQEVLPHIELIHLMCDLHNIIVHESLYFMIIIFIKYLEVEVVYQVEVALLIISCI